MRIFLVCASRSILVSFVLVSAFSSTSQAADHVVARSAGGMWGTVLQVSQARQQAAPWIRPPIAHRVLLDVTMLKTTLDTIPRQSAHPMRNQLGILSLPTPDGTFERFEIVSSSVMPPELAAKFPEIRTFRGKGIDNPSAIASLDMTPQGFHGQILSPKGSYYIDPYSRGDTQFYSSYYKRDFSKVDSDWSCATTDTQTRASSASSVQSASSGEFLRTYRLACAATGEYTAFHGGTVSAGLAAIVTAINRVSGIYELELGIRMELVSNNNLLVYTNSNSDPYTNNSGGAMLSQNQNAIDSIIGTSNYDFGHVFSTGGGGIAGLGVVCSGVRKAQGVTGLSSPTGDSFYVDFVAHEMGHQFGGSHTFNGLTQSCNGNRTGSSAYEPGSGSTIQAYAGICGADNIQTFSDPYFHSRSYDQIRTYIVDDAGSFCGSVTDTFNTPPIVDPIPNYTIPKLTPFELTAVGQDNNNDTLTYCWEERDLGPAQLVTNSDNGTSPIFRSFTPTLSPSRIFPTLTSIVDGSFLVGEQLPAIGRAMKFRVTVRDNRLGGGGIAFEETTIQVNDTIGPFEVTLPNGGDFLGGSSTIRWNVAGTDGSIVNATEVDILLSTDGGLTFPDVLASAVPNVGEAIINYPNVATTTARVRIQASTNVFFDISDNNFTIDPSAAIPIPTTAAVPYSFATNRYVSFDASISETVAMQVALISGPGLAGTLGWIGTPFDPGCQNADGTPKVGSCVGEVVSRIVPQPVFRAWPESLIHLGGCHIVPVATYEIRSTFDEVIFSSPFTISTAAKPNSRFWGDSVGALFISGWSGPDGLVTTNDIVSVIATFQRVSTAPVITRSDLGGQVPNFLINSEDILAAVNGFQGVEYPFAAPSDCP